jgi:hypothetical protein
MSGFIEDRSHIVGPTARLIRSVPVARASALTGDDVAIREFVLLQAYPYKKS